MPKMVCQICEVELKPEVTGVITVEMCFNNEEIYKIWNSDLWRCPKCGAKIVVGFPPEPFAGNWTGSQEELREKVAGLESKGKVIVYDKELIGHDKYSYMARESKKAKLIDA